MNLRSMKPLFLTFSPPAGRRNQRRVPIREFRGSMREFVRGILSPTLKDHSELFIGNLTRQSYLGSGVSNCRRRKAAGSMVT